MVSTSTLRSVARRSVDPEWTKNRCPADKSADGIDVVNVMTGKVERVLTGVSDPEQLAVSADGTRLYVASEDSSSLVVIRASDGKVLKRAAAGGEPEGVAVSASAKLVGSRQKPQIW